jgi:hypothetical protein
MAYTATNYTSKKQLVADFKAGLPIRVFQPGPFPLDDGSVSLEGPHYPKPHKWYSSGFTHNGLLVRLNEPGCSKENNRRAYTQEMESMK